LLFFFCEIKDLPDLQTTVSGGKGILSKLSRTLYLESGIVGERRLSFGDDRAAFSDDFVLVISVSRFFYSIESNEK
jgi:hypothetical protein